MIRFRPYPGLTIATVILVAILMALGFWQVQRLHWKLGLIAMMDRNMHERVIPLGGGGHVEWEIYTQYLHVTVTGHFENDKEIYVFATAAGDPVYHVLTPFVAADGGQIYLVDRGVVPKPLLDPSTRRAGQIEGPTRVTGFWHWPDGLSSFTPKPDLAHRIWYGRDLATIAAFDHLTLADPGILEADATPNPGGWPKGGQTVVDLPNNHFSYAVTWFGLAAGLIGVYFAYHISKGRLRRE